MKSQKILPIALVLSVVLITLTVLSSTVASQGKPLVSDSGLILLDDKETLCLTVVGTCDAAGPCAGPQLKVRSMYYYPSQRLTCIP